MTDEAATIFVEAATHFVNGVEYVQREPYWLYDERPYMSWQVLIKQHESLSRFEPCFRKGWEGGGEVEIFTLLPPGDPHFRFYADMLLHIRIYTKADTKRRKPGVRAPAISVQSAYPVFTYTEPQQKRITVIFMV